MAHNSKSNTPSKQPASSSNSRNGSEKKIKKESTGNDLSSTPIKFNDQEVKRMHSELKKREDAQLASRQLSSTLAKRSKKTTTTGGGGGITFKGFVVRVAIFYTLIAYFLVCPRDTIQSRSVCRGITTVESLLRPYEPLVKPVYNAIGEQINPYIIQIQSKISPYVDLVSPYYVQADNLIRPQVLTVSKILQEQVQPQVLKGIELTKELSKPVLLQVKQQYTSILAPSVEWYTNLVSDWYHVNVQSHYTLVTSTIKNYSDLTFNYVSPLYYEGLPLVHKHYKNTIKPITLSTYRTTRKTYGEEVHPRLIKGSHHLFTFYKSNVLPALQRFWSLYITPQVDAIRMKIFEYRTKKLEKEVEKEIQVVQEELKKELEVDDLEEFIAELRDTPLEVIEPIIEEPIIPAKVEEVLPTLEEQVAINAEKRLVLETLQTSYEKSIAKLGQTEHDLLVKRLIEIRSNAVVDIPKRFELGLEDLDGEGDKMVGRLQKYFAKVLDNDKLTLEEKVTEAELLAEKARGKVGKVAKGIEEEVEVYRMELREKEEKAVEMAGEALKDLVAKAQEELGFGWTWLDDVRHSDWARYHKLSKAQATWSEYHSGVASGSIIDEDLATLASPLLLLDDIKSQISSLVQSFEDILVKITIKGTQELKGETTVVEEVKKVVDQVVENVVEVVESVSSVVVGTPTPSTIPESVTSIVSVAQESVASVIEQVVEVVEQVTSTIIEAVVPEPTHQPIVESIYSVVAEEVSHIIDEVEHATIIEAVEDLLSSAVNVYEEEESTATPSTVPESATSIIESVISEVTQVVSSVYEEVISVVATASSAHPTDANFAESVKEKAASIKDEASSIIASVSSKIHDVVVESAVPVHQEL